MGNIYRIHLCDYCNMEFRERHIGPDDANLGVGTFEHKAYALMLIGPTGKPKKWTLCPSCAELLGRAIDKMMLSNQNSEG